MQGSLRQRRPGSWELRVHAGRNAATGRPAYVTRTVRGDRDSAERGLVALVAQITDSPTSPTFGTVGELCDKWWTYSSRTLLRPWLVSTGGSSIGEWCQGSATSRLSSFGRTSSTLGTASCSPAARSTVGHCRRTRCDTFTRCCTVRSSRASRGTGSRTTLPGGRPRTRRVGHAFTCPAPVRSSN